MKPVGALSYGRWTLALAAALALLAGTARAAEAAPANDAFADSTAVSGAIVQTTGSNVGATAETGEPEHHGEVARASVWWRWTAPSTGTFVVDTCGSSFETRLAVYTGSAPASLTRIASNDYSDECFNSAVQIEAQSGVTYRIAVDGVGGDTGSVSLTIARPLAHDDFAGARRIDGRTLGFHVGNALATAQAGEPAHAGQPASHSLWFRWTAPATGPVTVDTCTPYSIPVDTVLGIYTGSALGSLTAVGSSDDSSECGIGSKASSVTFAATAGTEYRIALDGKAGATGEVWVQLRGPPANDRFADAERLSGGSDYADGDLRNAGRETGEPQHGGDPGGHSVWFVWTAPNDGDVTLRSCWGVDTVIGVYTGAAVASLQARPVTRPAEPCEGDPGDEVTFAATEGTTYRIAVDGRGGAQGYYELSLQGRPENDDFADATLLESDDWWEGNTRQATRETGEPQHAGRAGGRSVWFRWVAPSTGVADVSACWTSFRSLLAVYTGTSLGQLTSVASADGPGECSEGEGSRVTFPVVAGREYRIALDGRDGENGSAELYVDMARAAYNDAFAGAASIYTGYTVRGSTTLAGKETGEPAHAGNSGGASLWYRWTADTSRKVTIATCGASFDSLLGVYTGSAVGGLTPVAANDDAAGCAPGDHGSSATFDAVGGTEYRIAVDGKGGASGRFPIAVHVAPSNDAFAQAAQVSTYETTLAGDNAAASAETGEPSHGTGGGRSVWFAWTAVTSGRSLIAVCPQSSTLDFTPLLAAYTGSALGSLTRVGTGAASSTACQNDAGVAFEATVTAGTTYRIAVDANGAGGLFSLAISAPPPGDAFDSPQPLTTGFNFGSNRMATAQAGEPAHAGAAAQRSVWHRWTAPTTGLVTLDTCDYTGTPFDTVLAVYTGDSLTSLTPVAANDDTAGCRSDGKGSRVTFTAQAGTEYRIAVDGRGAGAYLLDLLVAPPNDAFASAVQLDAAADTEIADLRNASVEPSEPQHAGRQGGHSVWYRWTPSTSGTAVLHTCSSSVDTVLAVYRGAAIGSLTPVASDDDGAGCQPGASRVSFEAVAGTEYRIAVDAKNGATGQAALGLNPAANDAFAQAVELVGASDGAAGSTSGASREVDEPMGGTGSGTVWFRWTAPAAGTTTVRVCGDTTYAGVSVFTGAAVGALSTVSTQSQSGSCPGQSVTFSATSGTTYRFAVQGYSSSHGRFRIGVNPPANDDIASAQAISGSSGSVEGSTRGATHEYSERQHAGGTGRASVWYRWVAPSGDPGRVTFDVCDAGFDAAVAVYFGTSYTGSLYEVASSEDGCSVAFDYVPGQAYSIAVDGQGADTGSFTLEVGRQVDPPANDAFATPVELGDWAASVRGDTTAAGRETGEPAHAGDAGSRSVWHVWTPPRAGAATIETCGSELDTLLAIYTGSALTSLTPVASSDDAPQTCGDGSKASAVTFAAQAGVAYRIAVDGKGEGAPFVLHVNRPANDDLARAQAVTDATAIVTGTTAGASLEDGEPADQPNVDGSVWYRWTAPATGEVSLHMCNPRGFVWHDVAVYERTAPRDLVRRGYSSVGACGGDYAVRATFSATAGRSYAIAVTGQISFAPSLEADEGAFTLVVNAPANDLQYFATDVLGSDPTGTGTTVGATREPGEGAHGGGADGGSIWFRWWATAGGPTTIETCGSGYDTVLEVVGAGTNDDACGTGSRITFDAVEGNTYLIAVDRKDATGGSVKLRVDGQPDVTAPDTLPYSIWVDHQGQAVNYFFYSNEPGVSYECSLDEAAWAPCNGSGRLTGLTAGDHALRARARDLAGNVDATPVVERFTVDLTPPETTIDSGPSGPTNVTSPLFEFSSNEAGTFTCAVDDGSFTSCQSPHSFGSLAEGAHTVRVRAQDEAGNVDPTPATRSFTVDRSPPETTLGSAPSGTIRTRSGSVAFTSPDSAATFECSLDSASFTACSSPLALANLADGSHTVQVRAVDTAGNRDPSPAARTFSVDATPPQSRVTSGPSGPTNDASPVFAFAANEPVSGFECALDSAPLAACGTSKAFTGLPDGEHVLRLRATDVAGNVEAEAVRRTFTVDTRAPETTITDGSPELTRDQLWAAFSSDEPGTLECALDDGEWTTCRWSISYQDVADGRHTIRVRARDAAGNVDATPAERVSVLDTTPPETTLRSGLADLVDTRSVELTFDSDDAHAEFTCELDGAQAPCESPHRIEGMQDGEHDLRITARDAAGNADPTPVERHFRVEARPPETTLTEASSGTLASGDVRFAFTADEPDSTFECALDDVDFAACQSPVDLSGVGDGDHTFRVRARDIAGNVDPTPAEAPFEVDTRAPDTTIEDGPGAFTNAAAQTFAFSSDEPRAAFECRLDSEDFAPCASPYVRAGLDEAEHTFEVRAVDGARNVDPEPASRTFVVDRTAPGVSVDGAPPEFTRDREASFAFSTSDPGATLGCAFDDEPLESCATPQAREALPDGAHRFTVRATDRAGNERTEVRAFTVDTVVPDTVWTALPRDPTNEDVPSIGFLSEAGATFACSVDEGPYEACEAPAQLPGLGEGDHVVRVLATDRAGNVEAEPAEHVFEVDRTPPDTTITEGPEGPFHEGAGFAFDSTEDGGFECAVDDGDWEHCGPPVALDMIGYAPGVHTFKVRSRDAAGNVDPTPAEREFTFIDEKPEATLAVSPLSGPANLKVTAAFDATDADGDQLDYELDFGDGTTENGYLPQDGAAFEHTYDRSGIFVVRLEVSDGYVSHVLTRTVTVTLPEPLRADAGDDLVAVAGEPAILDGGGSRPLIGIERYDWDFGDGSTGSGKAPAHTYESPGTYEAKLTTRAAAETDSDSVTVTVVEPSAAEGVLVTVSSGGTPLAGADAMVITGDGTRISGVTDAAGRTRLRGLPDGEVKVLAYRDGHIPASASVTVADGKGAVEIDLKAGEVAKADLTSHRMTYDEILAAGIDPDDPANQHVYEFTVNLEVTPPADGGGGGGSGGGSFGGMVGGGGFIKPGPGLSCRRLVCMGKANGATVIVTYHEVAPGVPTLTTLVIPFRVRWLKEFFDISMTVHNLAPEEFVLRNGAAMLSLPAGLSLAPTSRGERLTQPVADIAGGHDATTHWVVRGDVEGEYLLDATYGATLEPFGRSVAIEAAMEDPLKVWGGSALKLVVETDKEVGNGYPFHVRVGLQNVADVPVYNPGVELLKAGRHGYIEQPRQQREFTAPEIRPGATFWGGPFILVPEASGEVDLSRSYLKKVAGDVNLDGTIVTKPRVPTLDDTPQLKATGRQGGIILQYEEVAGATGYEAFSTPDRETDFPQASLSARQVRPGVLYVPGVSPDLGFQHFAVSTKSATGFRMHHPLATAGALDGAQYPRVSARCGDPSGGIRLHFEDPIFELTEWRYRLGDGGWQDGGDLSGFEANRIVRPDTNGKAQFEVQVHNTGEGEDGKGIWGPSDSLTFGKRGDANCDGVTRVAVIGDSYIAGEGAALSDRDPYREGTDFNPLVDTGHDRDLCHRSERSWAVQVAEKLVTKDTPVIDFQKPDEPNSAADGDVVAFLACSGAVSDNLDGVRTNATHGKDSAVQYSPERLTQLDRFDELEPESFDVVFLSIGGNDAEFGPLVTDCMLNRCLTMDGWKEAKLDLAAKLENRFAEVMAAVRGRARNAEVYAINYPDPVRPLPGHCAALGVELPKDWVSRHLGLSEANETHGLKIDTPEQRWISETFLPALNKSVAGAAHNQGFHLLDVSDAFRGRGICREDPYSHGLTLGNDKLGKGGVGILGNESFHPTPIGQDRLAAMFEARFKVDDVGRIPNLAPNTLTAFEDPDTLQIAISGDYVFTASGATTVLIENAPANEVILVSTYSLGGVAGRGKTDANGNASIPIRIPPSAAPGLHHLEIWTQSGRRLGAEPFLVGGSEACVGKPDVDGDSLTDLCDTDPKDGALADFDGDGVLNGTDVCPLVADVAQTDTDDDGEGNACDPDSGASLFQTGLRGPLTPGVSGPPSAPRNVQAVPVDAGRVKVTWQAPETDGGAALTAYRLRTSAAGTATDVAASNSSAVLAGLPAGSTLKIAVQAVNGAGAGAVALTAPVTVPKAPPGKGGGGGTTGGGGGTTGGGGGGTTGGGGGSTGGGQLGETAESSRVRLLAPKFDRRGKALTLKVKCLAADGRCTGRLDVLMGKRKLGTVKYSVAAGKSVKLRVKLRARPSKAVVVKAYAAKKKTPVATLKVRKPKR